MRYKDVFSIIGPSMVGPSSSHTAGAVRLGLTARAIFGALPEEAEITLYGSFAATGRGHGTDLAIVAGILGFGPDDERIREATGHAERAGVRVSFRTANRPNAHPNTATITLRGGGREDSVTGCSHGGGNIAITGVNRFEVKFSADYPTLLVFHEDRPAMIAEIAVVLGEAGINIGYMEVDRVSRHGSALTVLELDQEPGPDEIARIAGLSGVSRVCLVPTGPQGLRHEQEG
jgi:L-serine dehydratase